MWSDTELQHHIENEVGWELSAGLTQISVTVKSGAVELGGHVDSFWEKCAAERAAWRVAHVNHVTNGIRVVVPFNKQRDDDDIAIAANATACLYALFNDSSSAVSDDALDRLTPRVHVTLSLESLALSD